MNLTEHLESEQAVIQARLNALLKDGAACLVKDGDLIVTSFYLDTLEVLLPQPFFNRQSGELSKVTWWCCFREIHFEDAMQRSHLMHVTKFDWINERNLSAVTDDFTHLISAIDPAEVDPEGNAVWCEWIAFRRENPWLVEVAAEISSEYQETARRAIG
jgi:hypothetical protein